MTNKKKYHTLTIEETLKSLGIDPKSGLSSSEAGVRLNKYGKNKIAAKSGISPWKILADQFKDIIIVLLVIAAAVSFSIGDYIEGAAVLVVILITAFFGFITEYRAERSVEELQKMITSVAKVLRDGEIDEIDASLLVPGDIIIIEEGDRINADGRLLEADDLMLDESLLTGESEPVEKHIDAIVSSGKVAMADRKNMIYMGTMAAGGNGVAVVTNTGLGTEMGQISTLLSETEEESTPIEKQLAKTGRFLIIITFVITAVVAVVGVLMGESLVEMLKTSIALAVAAVPEGLPAVATITLAVGMRKMAKKNALMKNLPAVETLGSTTVICTDKTGTLTENQMTLQEIYLPGRHIDVTGTGYEPVGKFLEDDKETATIEDPVLSLFLKAGLLSSNAVLSDEEDGSWSVIGDPTEGALLTAAGKAGVDDTGYERIDELPFDSDRKYMAVKVKDKSGTLEIFQKGAPDVVMELCGFIRDGDSVNKLDDKRKEELLKINSEMASKGLRILALSYKTDFDVDDIVDDEVEKDMIFLGFAGILDPPRPDIHDSIEQARSAGIRVVMITGDQKDTALAIANKVGIDTGDGTVVLGSELDGLSTDELSELLEQRSVFARVSPENKLNIVRALKNSKHVTAMTGDGVNDAPALKRADIGISMGMRGTSVAKEASDMVLLDDSFSTIITAIRRGRVIFDNIQKFIHYLLSCNLSEIMLIFMSIVLRVPAPLVAIQILWLNLVTDVFPAFALAWEVPEKNTMNRSPREPGKPIITKSYKLRIFWQGFVIVLGPLLVYLATMNLEYSLEESRTIGFMALALVQLFHVFNVRRKNGIGFDMSLFKTPYLWGAFMITAGLQLFAIYVPFMQKVLKTVPLTGTMWLFVLAGAVAPIIFIQIVAWVRIVIGKPYRD